MGLRSGKMESNIWGETMLAKPTPLGDGSTARGDADLLAHLQVTGLVFGERGTIRVRDLVPAVAVAQELLGEIEKRVPGLDDVRYQMSMPC